MGKIASRCLKGCEGGKNEIGEENLEEYHIGQVKRSDTLQTNELNLRAKAGNNQKMEKFIEENKRKIKIFY